MIGVNRFPRANHTIGDEAKHLDESELMLRLVDFPAIKSHPGSMFLGIMDELEGIIGGASTSTQDPHDHIGIVLNELLHGTRSMVGYLEKNRTTCIRHAGQTSQNMVVDEFTKFFRGDT